MPNLIPTSTLLPTAIYQQARLAKDARFDGIFFTAVKSTKIYCRPICPAPSPKPQNVTYFQTAAAASAAGYRPCLRCRPELSPLQRNEHDVVQRALLKIYQGFLQHYSVADLAAELGLSARQLQRQFIHILGVAPNAVYATYRMLLAKQLLTETQLPLIDVALAAGFNSVRRFNSAFLEQCKKPPSALRKQFPQDNNLSDGLILRLAYRPPFDFLAMLAFLQKRLIPGIEMIEDNHYYRIIPNKNNFNNKNCINPILISVSNNPEKYELQLKIIGSQPNNIMSIVQTVRRVFDLDADLQAIYSVLQKDPQIKPWLTLFSGLRMVGGWDGFEVGIRAILGQQISVAAATTYSRRLVQQFGTPATSTHYLLPTELYCYFPTPQQIVNAHLESIGLPQRRADTLRALALAVLEGRLSFAVGQSLPEFIQNCMAIRGIGAWTAHYMAMRALGHPDAFPAGDLVLQNVFGEGTRLTEKQCELRSQQWQPWRAYSTFYAWQAVSFSS